MSFELLNLFVSPGHNYVGHHGRMPGNYEVLDLPEVRCLAGRGIRGDRYCDRQKDHKGQITFFAHEVFESLCEKFQVWTRPVSVFRRNVITRGIDLGTLIGGQFELQGIRFLGVEECKPCYWMDQAFCSGAEAALRGRGGLRARILSDGVLRVTDLKSKHESSSLAAVL